MPQPKIEVFIYTKIYGIKFSSKLKIGMMADKDLMPRELNNLVS